MFLHNDLHLLVLTDFAIAASQAELVGIRLLCLVWIPTMSFQTLLSPGCDVWLFLCRLSIWGETNAVLAQCCCHPEYRWRICPCALSLKYALTAMALFHTGVRFCVLSASGEMNGCCGRVFLSVIIFSFSISPSLCYQIEAGISAVNSFLELGKMEDC